MDDWMQGMTDLQRDTVARLESREKSCQMRFESLRLDEIDWKAERKKLVAERDALVKERDALQAQVDEGFAERVYGHAEDLAAAIKHVHALLAEREALRKRVAELEAESKPADRDLRERLVCAALTGMLANPWFDHEAETIVHWGLKYSDELIAAMRKEGGGS